MGGYLVAFARSFDTNIIYTLDKGLARVEEILIVNLFSENKIKEYHSWLIDKLKRREKIKRDYSTKCIALVGHTLVQSPHP